MGANYNTILVPNAPQEIVLAALNVAIERLGCRVVHCAENSQVGAEFEKQSGRVIFVGPSRETPWIPISSWGDGLAGLFPSWYRDNPLARMLANSLDPVIYFFTFDSGGVAGYSIFKRGQQVEYLSIACRADVPLAEFAPTKEHPQFPSLLGQLLGNRKFDFERFMRGFTSLEVATAALAARLGVDVHLLDPLDIQDGDGLIAVEDGEYSTVDPAGWIGVYYDQRPRQ